MNNKIKQAQRERVPFMLVVGEREAAEKTVTVRRRDTREQETIPFEQFFALVRDLRNRRRLDLGEAVKPS